MTTFKSIGIPFTWVCPGNEYHTFMVSVYDYPNEIFVDPFIRFPDIANPTDALPNSCLDEQQSHPQLITANMGSAFLTLNIISNILDNKPIYPETIGDVYKGITLGLGQPALI